MRPVHTMLAATWPLVLLAGMRGVSSPARPKRLMFRAVGAMHAAVMALALVCVSLRGSRSRCFRTVEAVLQWHGILLQALITALPFPQASSLWRMFPPPCLHALLRFACSVVALRLGCTVVSAVLTAPAPSQLKPLLLKTAQDVSPVPTFPGFAKAPTTPAVAGTSSGPAGGNAAASAFANKGSVGGGMGGGGGGGLVRLGGLEVRLLLAAAVGGLAAWVMDLALTAAMARLHDALQLGTRRMPQQGSANRTTASDGGQKSGGAGGSAESAPVALRGNNPTPRSARAPCEGRREAVAAGAVAVSELPSPPPAADLHATSGPPSAGRVTAAAAEDDDALAPPSRPRHEPSDARPPPPQQQLEAAPEGERPSGRRCSRHPSSNPELYRAAEPPAEGAGQSFAALEPASPQTLAWVGGLGDMSWTGGVSGDGTSGSGDGASRGGGGSSSGDADTPHHSSRRRTRCGTSAATELGAPPPPQRAGATAAGIPGAGAELGSAQPQQQGADTPPRLASGSSMPEPVAAPHCCLQRRREEDTPACTAARAAASTAAAAGAGAPAAAAESPPLEYASPCVLRSPDREDAASVAATRRDLAPELRLDLPPPPPPSLPGTSLPATSSPPPPPPREAAVPEPGGGERLWSFAATARTQQVGAAADPPVAAAAAAPPAGRRSVLYNSPVRQITVMFKLDSPPDVPYERVATSLTAAAHTVVDEVMGGLRREGPDAADAAVADAPAARRPSAGGNLPPRRWLSHTTQVHCLRGCVEILLRLQYEGDDLQEQELAGALTGLERELRQRAAVSGSGSSGSESESAAGQSSGHGSSSRSAAPPAADVESQYPVIVLQHPPVAPPPGSPPDPLGTAATTSVQHPPSATILPAAAAPDTAAVAAPALAAAGSGGGVGGVGAAGQEALVNVRFATALPLVAYMHPPVLAATVATSPFGTATSEDSGVFASVGGFGAGTGAGEPAVAASWLVGHQQAPHASVAAQPGGGDGGGDAGGGGGLVGGGGAVLPPPQQLLRIMEPWSSADCSGYFSPSRGASGHGNGRGGSANGAASGDVSSGAVTDSTRGSDPGAASATGAVHSGPRGHHRVSAGPPLLSIPSVELGTPASQQQALSRSGSAAKAADWAAAVAEPPLAAAILGGGGPPEAAALLLLEAAAHQQHHHHAAASQHRFRRRSVVTSGAASSAEGGGAAGSAGEGHRRPPRRRRTFDASHFIARGGGSDGDSGGQSRACPPHGAQAPADRRKLGGSAAAGGAASGGGGSGAIRYHPQGPEEGAEASAALGQPPGAALGPAAAAQPVPESRAGQGEGLGWEERPSPAANPASGHQRRSSARHRLASAPPGALDLLAPFGPDDPLALPAKQPAQQGLPQHPRQHYHHHYHRPQHEQLLIHDHKDPEQQHSPDTAHHQHQHHQHVRRLSDSLRTTDPAERPPPSPPPQRGSLPPFVAAAPASPSRQWALRPPEVILEDVVVEGVAESAMSLLPLSAGAFAITRSRTAGGNGGVRIDLFFDTDAPIVGGAGGRTDGSGGSGSSQDSSGGRGSDGSSDCGGGPEQRTLQQQPLQAPPPSVDVRVVVKQHGSVVAEVERLTVGYPRGVSVRLDLSGIEEGSAALLVLPYPQPVGNQPAAQAQAVLEAEAPAAALLYTPLAIVPPLVASELRGLMHEMQRAAATGPRRADPRVVRARAFTHHFSALVSDIVSLLLGCERVAEEAEAVSAAGDGGGAAPAADSRSAAAFLVRRQEELRVLGIGLVSYLIEMGLVATVRYLLDEVQSAGVEIRSGDLVGEEAVRHILGMSLGEGLLSSPNQQREQQQQEQEQRGTPEAGSGAAGKAAAQLETAGRAVGPPDAAFRVPPPTMGQGGGGGGGGGLHAPRGASGGPVAADHHQQQQQQQPQEQWQGDGTPYTAGGASKRPSSSNGSSSRIRPGFDTVGDAAIAGGRPAAPGLREVLLGFRSPDLERRFQAFLGSASRWQEKAISMALPAALPLVLSILAVAAGPDATGSMLLGGGKGAAVLMDGGGRCGGASCIKGDVGGDGGGGGGVQALMPLRPVVDLLPVAVAALGVAVGLLSLPAALCRAIVPDEAPGVVMQRCREVVVRLVHFAATALPVVFVWMTSRPPTDPLMWAAYTVAALVVVLQPAMASVRFLSYHMCWALDLIVLGSLACKVVGVTEGLQGVSGARGAPPGVAVAAAAAGLLAASAALTAWIDLQWRRTFLQ
ncbi:hypothetical protein PLESTM_001433300 [Pleodorina starrii]|nr:hypothetical protein PLESTM_001433300 [Pleodorina starrii]